MTINLCCKEIFHYRTDLVCKVHFSTMQRHNIMSLNLHVIDSSVEQDQVLSMFMERCAFDTSRNIMYIIGMQHGVDECLLH